MRMLMTGCTVHPADKQQLLHSWGGIGCSGLQLKATPPEPELTKCSCSTWNTAFLETALHGIVARVRTRLSFVSASLALRDHVLATMQVCWNILSLSVRQYYPAVLMHLMRAVPAPSMEATPQELQQSFDSRAQSSSAERPGTHHSPQNRRLPDVGPHLSWSEQPFLVSRLQWKQ
eukprot:4179157-Amphidinium_carterae.2